MKLSSVLVIAQSFTLVVLAHQIPLPTPISHHHHHVHHKHHTGDIASKVVVQQHPQITPMAKRDDSTETGNLSPPMPTLTTSTTYNAIVEVPNVKNPYIYSSNLPEGIVFIIVGGIIGLMFLSFISYRIIAWIISNRQAKHDTEHYYHNFNNANSIFGGSNGISSSSNSSMFEKNSSFVSNSSFYQLSRTNSLAQLDEMITTSSQPGRAYRDTVSGNIHNSNSTSNTLSYSNLANNRGSMFISPILETISGRRSLSNLELPLYSQPLQSQEQLSSIQNGISPPANDDNNSNILSPYTIKPVESTDSIALNDFDYLEAERLLMNNNNSDIESQEPSQSNHPYHSESHYYAQLLNNQHSHSPSQSNIQTSSNSTTTNTKKSRPPSVYLDDLLNDD